MTHMNLSMKQKQTVRHREQTVVEKGEAAGGVVEGELGVVNGSYYIWNIWTTSSYCITQRTIFRIL